jgi:hypothetical protein
MRDAQHRLVGRADRRFPGFERGVRGRRANEKNDAGGAESKLAKHFESPGLRHEQAGDVSSALASCVVAFSDGKPVSTFPENA